MNESPNHHHSFSESESILEELRFDTKYKKSEMSHQILELTSDVSFLTQDSLFCARAFII